MINETEHIKKDSNRGVMGNLFSFASANPSKEREEPVKEL